MPTAHTSRTSATRTSSTLSFGLPRRSCSWLVERPMSQGCSLVRRRCCSPSFRRRAHSPGRGRGLPRCRCDGYGHWSSTSASYQIPPSTSSHGAGFGASTRSDGEHTSNLRWARRSHDEALSVRPGRGTPSQAAFSWQKRGRRTRQSPSGRATPVASCSSRTRHSCAMPAALTTTWPSPGTLLRHPSAQLATCSTTPAPAAYTTSSTTAPYCKGAVLQHVPPLSPVARDKAEQLDITASKKARKAGLAVRSAELPAYYAGPGPGEVHLHPLNVDAYCGAAPRTGRAAAATAATAAAGAATAAATACTTPPPHPRQHHTNQGHTSTAPTTHTPAATPCPIADAWR